MRWFTHKEASDSNTKMEQNRKNAKAAGERKKEAMAISSPKKEKMKA